MESDDKTSSDSSWRALFVSGQILTVFMLGFGVWLHASNVSIISTLIPSAVLELGGVGIVNWTVTVYLVASIVTGAATGWFASRYNGGRIMAIYALFFSAGCTGCALAPDMFSLIASRLVQGIGGGGLVAMVFVCSNRLFPPAMVPRVVAFVSAIWGASALAGPLVGGLFAEAGLWRGGFLAFACQGLVLALALFVVLKLPSEGEPATGTPPLMRFMLFVAGVFSVGAAGVKELAPYAIPLMIGGAVLLVAFFVVDNRAGSNRLFPKGVMDPRTPVGAGIGMIFWTAAATISFATFGPLLLKMLHGIGPLQTGFMLASESVAWSVTALLVSGLDRYDRWLIRIGSTTILLGLSSLAFIVPGASATVLILPALVMTGGGFGMCFAWILKRIVTAAGDEDRTRASTGVPSLHLMGYAVGSALTGIVARLSGLHDGQLENAAFWIFAAFIPVLLYACFCGWRLSFMRVVETDPKA